MFGNIGLLNESHPLFPFKKRQQDKGNETKDDDEDGKRKFAVRTWNATDVYAEQPGQETEG